MAGMVYLHISIEVILSESQTTVEPLITHTSRWTAQSMGYQRLWAARGKLKIDSKNIKKFTATDGRISAKIWRLSFTSASNMLERRSFIIYALMAL
ncbi:hypothetical protein BDZ97DRAFT_70600 [Flammula alnicola]|nr:hypothetical protein BDZ97DRAFT_70600 [Flammula alnicola]